MKRIVRTSLPLAFFCVAAMPLRLSAQSACLPSDSRSASLVAGLQNISDTNSVADTVVRRKLGIPAVPATQIYLVSDTTTCSRARQALDSLVHATNPSAPALSFPSIYVFAVGAAIAVDLPANPNAPGRPVMLFDGTTWRFLGAVLLGG